MATIQKIVYRPGCDVLPLNSWSTINGRVYAHYTQTIVQDGYQNTSARLTTYSIDFEYWYFSGNFPCESGLTLDSHNIGTTYSQNDKLHVFEQYNLSGNVSLSNYKGASFYLTGTPNCTGYWYMLVSSCRRNGNRWQAVGSPTTVPIEDVGSSAGSELYWVPLDYNVYPTGWYPQCHLCVKFDKMTSFLIVSTWFDNTNLRGRAMDLYCTHTWDNAVNGCAPIMNSNVNPNAVSDESGSRSLTFNGTTQTS